MGHKMKTERSRSHSLVITWSQPRRVEARIGADGRPHPSTIRRYPDASEQ
jgi:hypothetical protein